MLINRLMTRSVATSRVMCSLGAALAVALLLSLSNRAGAQQTRRAKPLSATSIATAPCKAARLRAEGPNRYGVGTNPKGTSVAPLTARAQIHYLENFAPKFRMKESDIFAEEALAYVVNGAVSGYRIRIGEGLGELRRSVDYTFSKDGMLIVIESRPAKRSANGASLIETWVCQDDRRR